MSEPRYQLDALQMAIIRYVSENPGRNLTDVASAVQQASEEAPSQGAVRRTVENLLKIGCYDSLTKLTVPMILDRTPMRPGRRVYSLHVTEHGREALSERNRSRSIKVLSTPGDGNGHREKTVGRVLGRTKGSIEW